MFYLGVYMNQRLKSWLQGSIAGLAAASLFACSSDARQITQDPSVTEFSDPYSEQVFQILLAEYYFHNNEVRKSADSYLKISSDNNDAAIAQRATEIALQINDLEQALVAAKRWKKLDAASSDVNQYLVLLFQRKEQYADAATALADLVKAYPSVKSKAIEVAVALLEQQSNEKGAYQTLRNYVEKHEQSDIARYYLAVFAMRAELFEEALKVTDSLKAITDKEVQRKAALLRVKAFSALDQSEEALAELSQLITEAADVQTRQQYGRLMASLGKEDEAVKLLAQVAEKHPENAGILLDMIAINLGNDKYAESLPLVDKLGEIKGHEFSAHYYRGLIHESLEDWAKALAEYRLIEDKDKANQVITRIVNVLQELEGVESALSYLRDKQFKYKGEQLLGSLYIMESEILRDANRVNEALVANQKAAELSPMNLDILYAQALLYEDANQVDKSEEMLLKILRADKNNSAALNALGYMLSVHTTRFDEAYKYIKQAYDLEPEDPAIIDSLGWVSYRKGDLVGAEHYLRLAYQKLQDPEVASHLIEVLSKQGHLQEAKKLLEEMLQQYPGNDKLLKAQAIIMGMKSK